MYVRFVVPRKTAMADVRTAIATTALAVKSKNIGVVQLAGHI